MSEISDVSQLSQLSDLDTKGEPTYNNFKDILLNCLCIAMGNLFIGYNYVNFLGFHMSTLKKIYSVSIDQSTLSGIIGGIYPFGGCIGCVITQMLLDNFSRRYIHLKLRNLLRLVCVCAMLSTIITLFTNYKALFWGRFFCGMCSGVLTSLCLIYTKQLAPQDIRGKIGVICQMGGSIGQTIGLSIAVPFLSNQPPSEPSPFWWIPLLFPLVFLLPQLWLLTYVYTDQTPKYHLIQHQEDQAFKIVKKIYRQKYVWDMFYRIFRDAESERKRKQRHQPTNKLAIVCATVVSLSISPPRIILNGSRAMFSIDFGVHKGMVIYIWLNALSILTTIFTTYMSELKRRNMILFGQFSVVLLMFLVGVASESVFHLTQARTIFAVINMIVFRILWDLTLLTATWVYISQTVQPKVVPWISFFHWFSTALVSFFFPIGTYQLNMSWMYLLLGCWELLLATFSYFFVVQSMGKSEIQLKQQFQKIQSQQLCF